MFVSPSSVHRQDEVISEGYYKTLHDNLEPGSLASILEYKGVTIQLHVLPSTAMMAGRHGCSSSAILLLLRAANATNVATSGLLHGGRESRER